MSLILFGTRIKEDSTDFTEHSDLWDADERGRTLMSLILFGTRIKEDSTDFTEHSDLWDADERGRTLMSLRLLADFLMGYR